MKEIIIDNLGIKVTIGLNKLESQLENERWKLVSIITEKQFKSMTVRW